MTNPNPFILIGCAALLFVGPALLFGPLWDAGREDAQTEKATLVSDQDGCVIEGIEATNGVVLLTVNCLPMPVAVPGERYGDVRPGQKVSIKVTDTERGRFIGDIAG